MENFNFLHANSHLYEYKLIIQPPQHVEEKIVDAKKQLHALLNIEQPVKRAHLMIAHFYQYQLAEEKMRQKLKQAAIAMPPVMIEMKDYNSYPAHSIFIQVNSKIALLNMTKYIRTNVQKYMKGHPEHTPHFINDPQLILATKLLPWQYETGWNKFKYKHFTARFVADSLLLLRRSPGEKGFRIMDNMQLENMPLEARQGLLF